MRETQANGIRLDGASWLSKASWAEGPASV